MTSPQSPRMHTRAHIEPVEIHADARGFVLEPAGPAELVRQRNAHLVVTEPGAVRGNHYHERGTEISVVLGPALVRLREQGELRDIEVPVGTAYRLIIPPGVSHAFRNTGSAPMILIGLNTEPLDRAHPDVIRDILIVST